jgi:drug/metabolite transporter (DMT)-like permease
MIAVPSNLPGLLWANLIALVSILAWCVGLPATEVLVADIPPLALTALRMTTAGLVLVAVWVATEGPGPLRAADWRQGILVGAVVMGVGGLGATVALDLTDAVTVAIVSATMPIAGLALEVLLDRRRITRGLVAGLVLGVAGGILALDVGHATPALGIGALAALVAVVGYAWGSRATVKRFPALSPLGRAAVTVSGAGIATGALTLVQAATTGTGIAWAALGWPTLGALVASAVVGVSLAQFLWVAAVGRIGIGVASLHSNAAPFYVMLIALALGQPWNAMKAVGAAVVILGVLVAQDMLPVPRRWRPVGGR